MQFIYYYFYLLFFLFVFFLGGGGYKPTNYTLNKLSNWSSVLYCAQYCLTKSDAHNTVTMIKIEFLIC